jgi:uncharacterized protein (DUF934 family)
MAQVIRNRRVEDDRWETLPAEATVAPEGPVIVPLALWKAHREELIARRQPVGVWLAPATSRATSRPTSRTSPIVAVHFPKWGDGRGYSTAALLRRRYGYRGELRAFGDLGRDHVFMLARVGFDSSGWASATIRTPRSPRSTISRCATRGRWTIRCRSSASARRGRAAMTLELRVSRASRLLAAIEKNHSPAALASSFGAEDMVSARPDRARRARHLHLHARHRAASRGNPRPGRAGAQAVRNRDRRLFAVARFGRRIRRAARPGRLLRRRRAAQGVLRVRKVEPLKRALAGKRGWITGLRREQADTRGNVAEAERDPATGLWKFSPLADWSDDDDWTYLRANKRSLQRAARPRLSVHRLRAVHARRASRRAPARRPLVVGA